jgi:choline dehydrogenase
MRRIPALLLVFLAASCSYEDRELPTLDESGCAGAKCDDVSQGYDYIVVGSGAGGGTLASRLARKGFRVLLLEAGEDPGGKPVYQIPAFHGRATEEAGLAWWYFVEHYTDPARQALDSKRTPEGILYPRGGALGGSTAVNAMITVLPKRSDWDAIAGETDDASWRASEMDRYYDRVREWLDVERPDPTLALKDLRVVGILFAAVHEYVASTGSGSWAQSILDIGRTVKELKKLMSRDINDSLRRGETSGLYTFPLATKDGARNGTRERILETVREDYPLTVKTKALVTRVIFSSEPGAPRAVGVEYLDGSALYQADLRSNGAAAPTRQAYAKTEIILSAGAFNTPQLLLLSGVGPRADLEALGIQVKVDLPGVGRNLQDRYEVGVVSEVDDDFAILGPCEFDPYGDDDCLEDWHDGKGPYETNGALASILVRSSASQPEADLHIFGVPGVFKGYKPGYSFEATADKRHFTWVILKGHSQNRGGTVKLRSADPRVRPAINFHYFDDGDVDQGQDVNDLTAVVNAIELVRRIGNRTDAIPFFGAFHEVWPGAQADTRQELGDWVKAEAWGHHASCSAKIGADADPEAVLDSRFRVRGTRGLRVVDASVFPRIPGTFIALPTYMIAEKAADVIAADAN